MSQHACNPFFFLLLSLPCVLQFLLLSLLEGFRSSQPAFPYYVRAWHMMNICSFRLRRINAHAPITPLSECALEPKCRGRSCLRTQLWAFFISSHPPSLGKGMHAHVANRGALRHFASSRLGIVQPQGEKQFSTEKKVAV